MNLVGRNAIISGWGKTTQKSFGQTGTNLLQTTSVPIISITTPLTNLLNLIFILCVSMI